RGFDERANLVTTPLIEQDVTGRRKGRIADCGAVAFSVPGQRTKVVGNGFLQGTTVLFLTEIKGQTFDKGVARVAIREWVAFFHASHNQAGDDGPGDERNRWVVFRSEFLDGIFKVLRMNDSVESLRPDLVQLSALE